MLIELGAVGEIDDYYVEGTSRPYRICIRMQHICDCVGKAIPMATLTGYDLSKSGCVLLGLWSSKPVSTFDNEFIPSYALVNTGRLSDYYIHGYYHDVGSFEEDSAGSIRELHFVHLVIAETNDEAYAPMPVCFVVESIGKTLINRSGKLRYVIDLSIVNVREISTSSIKLAATESGKLFCDHVKITKKEEVDDGLLLGLSSFVESISQFKEEVEQPSHYMRNGVECKDWIREALTEEEYKGYLKGNVLKYMFRHEMKEDPHKDLAKARQYVGFLDDYLSFLEGSSEKMSSEMDSKRLKTEG